jgi:hypothetical protein
VGQGTTLHVCILGGRGVWARKHTSSVVFTCTGTSLSTVPSGAATHTAGAAMLTPDGPAVSSVQGWEHGDQPSGGRQYTSGQGNRLQEAAASGAGSALHADVSSCV